MVLEALGGYLSIYPMFEPQSLLSVVDDWRIDTCRNACIDSMAVCCFAIDIFLSWNLDNLNIYYLSKYTICG